MEYDAQFGFLPQDLGGRWQYQALEFDPPSDVSEVRLRLAVEIDPGAAGRTVTVKTHGGLIRHAR